MQDLKQILDAAVNEIQQIKQIQDLDQLKTRYLGKLGIVTQLMQQMKDIIPAERREFGAKVNQLKDAVETEINACREEIFAEQLIAKLNAETIDVTLAGRKVSLGSLHPVNLSLKRAVEIFAQLGFSLADGPEIENDYYNFEALNVPADHPARAMQDTFYTESGNLLRTHTSPIQVRYAEKKSPPIKVIAPGRVYRVDMDATHSPMFHQIELLWIDEGVNFANLKAVVVEFMRKFFADENLNVRFRASFFPFTEPSAEVDIFSVKSNRWLEVGGCGMVHPNVLDKMGVDRQIYNGFAFGFGLDRLTMLNYEINDLRLMFDNDLDFLLQFKGL